MTDIAAEDAAHAESGAFRGELATLFERQARATAGGFSAALGRLLAPAETALPVAVARAGATWAADPVAVRDLVTRAQADRAEPWPQPLATGIARLHEDGDRNAHEQLVFARQHRLSRAVVAAAATGDDAWLADVLDGVWLLCEQSSWCWPAHDDAFAMRGSVLPTVTVPFLDLGAGEVVGQLAWIDHVLGDRLETRYPGIRHRIRHEARVRVIEPFLARRDWHWLGLSGRVHNWSPWIHGNVLVAALRLLDGPDQGDERVRVVALAIEGIDRYVSTLPADGAIDEGYSYWWNGACRALEALDIVRHATGGALDASAVPALREAVAFPHRMHLGGDWYLNLADGQARPSESFPWHALHRAARAAGDTDASSPSSLSTSAAAHAASHRIAGRPAADELAGLGRLLRGITDAEWVDAPPAVSPFPRDVWLPSTQVLVARERGGTPAGLTVAVKGGHNDENHNHNDVGSFVVASDGVPVIVDAGRPTYTRQTFGPERYDTWTMRSAWHNVPVISGAEQGVGAEFAARDVEVAVGDDVSSLSAELAGAYPGTPAESWRRTVRLDRGARRVEIDDAWGLSRGAGTEVRMLLAGDVALEDGCASITPRGGATPVRITWPRGIPARLIRRELDDPMLSSVWGERLTRLDLDVASRDSISVAVELDLSHAKDAR